MLSHIAMLKDITNSRERKEAVASMLKRCNLYDERKKALSGFSGGMLQRFGIAQALIGNPQLQIVDEPTAGLDPASGSISPSAIPLHVHHRFTAGEGGFDPFSLLIDRTPEDNLKNVSLAGPKAMAPSLSGNREQDLPRTRHG